MAACLYSYSAYYARSDLLEVRFPKKDPDFIIGFTFEDLFGLSHAFLGFGAVDVA